MPAGFPKYPGVGRFEAASFVPERWVPHYPNPAFDNARADDLFWAARRVMAFSDDAIRTIVEEAQLSEPAAARYLGDTLMARRDAIGRAWLTQITPLVDFVLDRDGLLTFENAAVHHNVATTPLEYRARWCEYDNAVDVVRDSCHDTVAAMPMMRAPYALLAASPAFIKVDIAASHPEHPSWAQPVEVYFREATHGWETVGVFRLPES